jgi:peptide/nickel transport system permease protein
VLAALSWLGPARLVRGETLSLRTREYVQAVRLMAGSSLRIILRHIAPNAIGTIIVNATFQVADAILALATLSFLGFGLPPPAATWGGMLSNGTNYLFDGYWWEVYPAGVMIVVTVIAFNFIGDALRDAVEVRLQRR